VRKGTLGDRKRKKEARESIRENFREIKQMNAQKKFQAFTLWG